MPSAVLGVLIVGVLLAAACQTYPPGGTVPPSGSGAGSTAATPTATVTDVSTNCVAFNADPHDTLMGAQFGRNGFKFTSLDASFLPFINDIAPGVVGLQFGNGGLDIQLPRKASQTTFEAGAWAQPVVVTAYDGTGRAVAALTVPKQNTLGHFQLAGSGITRITLVGGNNEGLLAELCARTPGG